MASLSKLLALSLVLAAFLAPNAVAAEGVGPAKALRGTKTKTTSTVASGSNRPGSGSSGSSKEDLSLATVKPGNGQTVSGTVGWEVAVSAGSANKIEFAVDGA